MNDYYIKKPLLDIQYNQPEIFALSQSIFHKPTKENLKKLLSSITDECTKSNKEDSRTLFLCYLARCNEGRALKNDFLNQLTKSNTDFQRFYEILNDAIKEIWDNYEKEQLILSTKNIVFVFPAVNIFYQMAKDKDEQRLEALIGSMLPVYDAVLAAFNQQLQIDFGQSYNVKNEELFSLSIQSMKQILWIFVKMPECDVESYRLAFMDYCYRILYYESIGIDMKSKCALIFLHCLKNLPEIELVNFVFKDNPLLEIMNDPIEKDSWICGKNFKYTSLLDGTTSKALLLSALYNCLPLDEQFTLILSSEKCVYQSILEQILECTNRPFKGNNEIVEVSKNLVVISEGLCQCPIEIFENIFEKALLYVNCYCEYPSDQVQKYSSLFLSNIVKTSCIHFENVTKFVEHLINTINLVEGKRRIDFITIVHLCINMKAAFLLRHFPNLQKQMQDLISDPLSTNYAAHTYDMLMTYHYQEVQLEEWLSIWVKPVLEKLKHIDNSVTPMYHRILLKAFQLTYEIIEKLFPSKYMGTHREWALLLKCLCIARTTKLSAKVGNKANFDSTVSWRGLVEKSKLKLFAMQRDDTIRISALKVVVECQKTTEYFTDWELTYLSEYFFLNGCSQVPQIRRDIVTLYKKVFTRYFASLDAIRRQLENYKRLLEGPENTEVERQQHEHWIGLYSKLGNSYSTFLRLFMNTLMDNISPDTNFYRRTSALELLSFIQTYLRPQAFSSYWSYSDIENLKRILFDSYEVNKKMALGILCDMEPEQYMFHDPETYTSYMRMALSYASDIKPSKSLSAAYMFQLCCKSPLAPDDNRKLVIDRSPENDAILRTIQTLSVELMGNAQAKISLQEEVDVNSPCYGLLTCLRYLFKFRPKGLWNEQYSTTYKLIYSLCRRIFRAVLPIVSNPAPEGYLPDNEETEIAIRDDTVQSQKILVYAWRTVKEITLLFAEFVQQNKYLVDCKFLSDENYKEIGEFFMEIFIQAKHRGVFEQAYLGFCIICEEYWIFPTQKLSSLPMQWLRRGLDLVTGVKIDSRLCPTRRSAGMPFLILAILTTDPSLDKMSVRMTMKELMVAAGNDAEDCIEYRTHSFNILRFLFGHSKLSDYVPQYVEKATEIALKGMQCREWGVRNSATLLFSALFNRIYGVSRTQDFEMVTNKNKMPVKVFSTRYPQLYNYLIDTLKVECKNRNSLVLHPILMLFSRIYPGFSEPVDVKLEEVKLHIRECMKIPDNEIRKLAVMASISLRETKDLCLVVKHNFEAISQRNIGNNEMLALLLEAWYTLKVLGDQCDVNIGKIVNESIYILEMAGTKFSHYCVSLYMEVLTFLFGNVLRYNERVELDALRKILTSISRLMEEQELNLTGKMNFEAAMVNLTITILLVRLEHVDTTYQAIAFDFENYLSVNQNKIMKNYCLHFVLNLNISYNEFGIPEPPLYIFEELHPMDSIEKVLANFNAGTKCDFLVNIHKFMVDFLQNELVGMQTTSKVDESFILVLLILPYYPCILETLHGGRKQETLDMLLQLCSCDREEVISAVITCAGVLLSTVERGQLKELDYRKLIKLLGRSAAPEAAIYRKLSVVQFLVKCKFLYYRGTEHLKLTPLASFLNIVLVLLEDESIKIRNEMSSLTDDENKVELDENTTSGWPCCPEKARFDFLRHCYKILPRPLGVCFLLSWGLKHSNDSANDLSEVFERSEHNTFSEKLSYIQFSAKILNPMLWGLNHGLNYEDRSIFREEQTAIVSTMLHDALNNYTFHMVDRKTKMAVVCALRSILNSLDTYIIVNNFKQTFSEYFKTKTLCYLKKQVCERDYHSVKSLLLKLYSTVLLADFDYR